MMISLHEKKDIETYVLRSKDSDFIDIAKRIIEKGKRVILFSTPGKIASERITL
jgi:uncharacterized LabA/DUF88 family protein